VDWIPPFAERISWGGGLVPFDRATASSLTSEMGVNAGMEGDLFCGRLIDWIRGAKIGEEGTDWTEDIDPALAPPGYPPAGHEGEHWKMADSVHGGMAELGRSPAFPVLGGSRRRTLFVQSNLGLLHAFDAESGRERWAFIPPNILAGGRLAGLKRDEAGPVRNARSVPRWLLDGPLVLEDVRLDGVCRTLLFGLTGRGGAGIYVLDVTETDRPRFLWAVENDVFLPSASDDLTFPRASSYRPLSSARSLRWMGSLSGPAVLEEVRPSSPVEAGSTGLASYGALGLTTGTPTAGWISTLRGPREVLLLGDGAHPDAPPSWPNPGALLLVDPVDGTVLTTFARSASGASSASGHFVAGARVLRKSRGTRELSSFLAGDDRGSVWSGEVTGSLPSGIAFREILSGGLIATRPLRSGFAFPLVVADLDGEPWLFAGTGTTEGLLPELREPDEGDDYFIALRLSAWPRIRSENDLGTFGPEGEGEGRIRADGWFMPYNNPGFDAGARLSAPPVLAEVPGRKAVLLFSTYTSPSGDGRVGTTRLFVLDPRTGLARRPSRYVELKGPRILGMACDRSGKIHLELSGVSGASAGEIGKLGASFAVVGTDGADSEGSVQAAGDLLGPEGLDPAQELRIGPEDGPGGSIRTIYWRVR
jgi:type IV pilus assembly protein PilY1